MNDTSRWFPVPYILGIALLLTVIVAFQNYLLSFVSMSKPEFQPGTHILYPFINYGFWALLSPFVWRTLKNYPPVPGRHSQRIRVWLTSAVAFALIHELATNVLFYGIKYLLGMLVLNADFFTQTLNLIALGAFSRFLEFWIIFFGLMIYRYYKAYKDQQLKLAQIKGELYETKLEALKAQLHPHFLFNTLNSVSALMAIDIQSAQKMLANLARLLRALFKNEGEHLVTLNEELEYIGYYLSIEQARYSDRLMINYQVHPETRRALVPKLILQPLVENSIEHGISKRNGKGKISIGSRREGEFLVLTVTDNGNGVADTYSLWQHAGIGLANTKARLRQLYEDRQSIEIISEKGSGFKIDLKFLFEYN